VTRAGADADRASVRIDAIGYAPTDVRPPLLSLGELSKDSNGAFRWIRVFPALTGDKAVDAQRKQDPDTINGVFKKLYDEIQKQYVLTLFVAADDVPKKVAVSATIVDRALK